MNRKDVDSGWAWVVLAASYMNLFLLSGVCYTGGMFQLVFLEQFQQGAGLTAWVTSLFASLMLLAGPLTSVITYHFGCRASVMLGGVLLACGLAASSFVTSLAGLFVTFGVFAGLGLGLSYTPTVVVVNFYFEKKRTLVTSVALSASGAGLLLAPLLCRYLLDNFALRECLLVLAGICFHVTLFGALMFPIHERKNHVIKTPSRCCGHPTNTSDAKSYDFTAEIDCSRKLAEVERFELGSSSRSLNVVAKNESTVREEVCRTDLDNCHLHVTEETERDKMIKSSSSYTAKSPLAFESGSQLDIFRNRAFIVFLCSTFLVNAGCGIFNIHLPAFCESYGTTTMQVALVMAVNGPANMVSRVLLGAFAHTDDKDVWVLYFGTLLATSTVLVLMPTIARTYISQLMTVMLVGTYLGGSYALPPVLTIHCVGINRLASAFGITMVCSGLGWLVAPPMAAWKSFYGTQHRRILGYLLAYVLCRQFNVAGWFVDLTGTYDASMYLAGAVIFVSALVGLVVPLILHPENNVGVRRSEDNS